MMKFLLRTIGFALVVYYVLPYFVSGISVQGVEAAILTALIFALINAFIKPILKIITLPLNILSFGIFGIILNVLLFWFVASLIQGFQVVDLTAAFWGALIMAIAGWFLNRLL